MDQTNETDRAQLLEDFVSGYREVVETLNQIPRDRWHYRPGPGKWSIHEIVIHLADAEAHSYVRVRSAVAEPGKRVMAFDQDAYPREMDYTWMDLEDHLELFRLMRKTTCDLLLRLPEEAWTRTMDHSEAGVMSLDKWLVYYSQHARNHAAQMRRNSEAWAKRG